MTMKTYVRTHCCLHAVLTWRMLILLGAASAGFTVSPVERSRRRGMLFAPPFRAARQNGDDDNKSKRVKLILPVFPLRKSVRMPSEALTLNLYEPRYLELAKYVLEEKPRWFGALYCSKKPQFMQQGEGPIVPMVEPGDVGVVCDVLYDEEAMVPVLRNDDNGPLRRRIKLKGLAVGRFRIEKVLHNGYGGGLLCDGNKNVEPLSFIVVEASRVDDVPIIPGTEDEQRVVYLENELYTLILEREGLKEKVAADLWGDLAPKDTDDNGANSSIVPIVAQRLAPLLPSHLKGGNKIYASTQQSPELQSIEKALFSWTNGSTLTIEDQKRQLFSFALSVAAAPERSADEAMVRLQGTSTYERLQDAYDELQKSQSWLSIFSSFL